jgi:uncharacterized protein
MIRAVVFIFLLSISSIQLVRPQQTVHETSEFDISVKILGRYLEDQGIELRLFPQNKAVLDAGLRSGFIIERSTEGTDDFIEIARIFPWTEPQWIDALGLIDEGSETYNIIELAMDFLEASPDKTGGSFDFEKGIGDMKQQKSDEDFEYMIFMITALRETTAAQGLALAFTDSNVIPGQTYTYRATTIEKPQIYTVVPDPYTMEASSEALDYAQEVFFYEGDEEISFVWNESELLFGFDVERQNPGEIDFVKLNEAPIYTFRYRKSDEPVRNGYHDKELVNYQRYSYRFFGRNVFGERIRFAALEAMPRDRTPPEQPRITRLEHVAPREVLLGWEMNDPPSPDLFAFIVARADAHDGDFELIHPHPLPAGTRSFTDTAFMEGQKNYYIIQAVDTAFNISTSLPSVVTLIDTIPPAVPVWLSGEIDSTGVVTLEVLRNTERDLMGYRLFRANDPEHEFSAIYEGFVDDDSLQYQISTIFKDTVTLNSLTPRIYYKIKALDFNFNQSDFSEMMVIVRPDTIPPTTPVFRRVVSRTSEIELHFALSQSRDVAAHELYRNTSLQQPWELYSLLENTQMVFTDTLAEKGQTYYYTMRAVDLNGNYSDFARPVFGKAYDDGVRPPVGNMRIAEEEGLLVLTWEYQHVNDDTYFAIYKSNGQGTLNYIRRTKELVFKERYAENEKYQYAVKVFTTDGGESIMSEPVSLR